MSSRIRRKTLAILVMLLVGIIVLSVTECQLHASMSADHSAPAGDHSASHFTGSDCLIAVLPTHTLPIAFLLVWVAVAALLVQSNLLAFPLFIPPRPLAR